MKDGSWKMLCNGYDHCKKQLSEKKLQVHHVVRQPKRKNKRKEKAKKNNKTERIEDVEEYLTWQVVPINTSSVTSSSAFCNSLFCPLLSS